MWDNQKGERMIRIVLKNGRVIKWKKKEWTDYKYDGRYFIIVKNKKWIGFYNLDSIISIAIH